jgi:hypothetical protein
VQSRYFLQPDEVVLTGFVAAAQEEVTAADGVLLDHQCSADQVGSIAVAVLAVAAQLVTATPFE